MTEAALSRSLPPDTVEFVLADGNVAIIDKTDTHLLGKYTWRLRGDDKRGQYVARRTWTKGRTKQITILLHRLILDAPADMFVDHIDGNTLNNSRSNLRVTSHKQNCWNRMWTDSLTGFKGVRKRGGSGKFTAVITKDGIRYYLGTFESAEEAAIAYNTKALELFGEYARLNTIPNEEAA